MTTITTSHETTFTPTRKLWPAAVAAAVAAAAATTTVAATAHASGVSLDVAGEPIPVLAFAQMTVLFSLVGLGIAAGLRRWTRAPRRAWLRTTVVLTALSLVPDLLADAAVSTRLTLMTTHVVAALIVIPTVAARFDRG